MTDILSMTAADKTARERTLARFQPGMRLRVTAGLKAGREAIYQRPDADNPWLVEVLIDRVPRVVRWQWVERLR